MMTIRRSVRLVEHTHDAGWRAGWLVQQVTQPASMLVHQLRSLVVGWWAAVVVLGAASRLRQAETKLGPLAGTKPSANLTQSNSIVRLFVHSLAR